MTAGKQPWTARSAAISILHLKLEDVLFPDTAAADSAASLFFAPSLTGVVIGDRNRFLDSDINGRTRVFPNPGSFPGITVQFPGDDGAR